MLLCDTTKGSLHHCESTTVPWSPTTPIPTLYPLRRSSRSPLRYHLHKPLLCSSSSSQLQHPTCTRCTERAERVTGPFTNLPVIFTTTSPGNALGNSPRNALPDALCDFATFITKRLVPIRLEHAKPANQIEFRTSSHGNALQEPLLATFVLKTLVLIRNSRQL